MPISTIYSEESRREVAYLSRETLGANIFFCLLHSFYSIKLNINQRANNLRCKCSIHHLMELPNYLPNLSLRTFYYLAKEKGKSTDEGRRNLGMLQDLFSLSAAYREVSLSD